MQDMLYTDANVLADRRSEDTSDSITMAREPRCIFGAEDPDSFSISSIRVDRHARTVLSLAATNNDNHRDK